MKMKIKIKDKDKEKEKDKDNHRHDLLSQTEHNVGRPEIKSNEEK